MAFFDTPYSDQTDGLMNSGQFIQITHVPTGKTVFFKAWITRFEDRFSSDWKGQGGYGRMDEVQVFSKTSRTLSVAFKLVAADLEEARDNMVKVSALAQMLYPTFDGVNGAQTLKASPLLQFKFMNWAQNSENGMGLLAASKGFSFSPVMEAGVFTLRDKDAVASLREQKRYAEARSSTALIYPRVFTIDTTLTIIHEHPLGWKFVKPEKATVSSAPPTQQFRTATSVSWFAAQSPQFPYGEFTSATGYNVKQENVSNPEYTKAQKEKAEAEAQTGRIEAGAAKRRAQGQAAADAVTTRAAARHAAEGRTRTYPGQKVAYSPEISPGIDPNLDTFEARFNSPSAQSARRATRIVRSSGGRTYGGTDILKGL